MPPHSVWAEVYDLAYEESFGSLYHQLTQTTVDVIAMRLPPPAAIVDFGAGTGRLSIPLAAKGYHVTAVDPCVEMLRQLEQKRQNAISTFHSKMEEFSDAVSYDMALCVFTVVTYLLDEKSLIKSLKAAHSSLRADGLLLIDVPSKAVFRSYATSSEMLERQVSVTRQEGDVYFYRERLKVRDSDRSITEYDEEFPIRYWQVEQVMNALRRVGFAVEKDLSDHFCGTGSKYYLLRKVKQGA